jgi:hypothetical protein
MTSASAGAVGPFAAATATAPRRTLGQKSEALPEEEPQRLD